MMANDIVTFLTNVDEDELRAELATHAGNTSNPHGVTAEQVGADPTGSADAALASAKTYADSAAAAVKNDLLNGAGAAYDTLKELGDLIDDNQDAIGALETVAAGKADASALTEHVGDTNNPHGVTWEQLPDKPFYSEVLKSITWDGNTEGLTVFDAFGFPLYKVTDEVIDYDTLMDGYTIITNIDEFNVPSTEAAASMQWLVEESILILMDGVILIVLSDFEADDISMEKGIYFASIEGEVSVLGLIVEDVTQIQTKFIDPSFRNLVVSGTFSQNRKDNTVIGIESHTEGYDTTASGEYSHAEGYDTTASGNQSHAEGGGSIASGAVSHAEGIHTIAAGTHQHVQGKFNIEDTDSKYAHIVGNGNYIDTRSNAHTLDWDGNAWFQGDVYVGGTGQDDGTKLSKEGHTHDEYAAVEHSHDEYAAVEHTHSWDKVGLVSGDTLTWDGNTGGLVCVGDVLYKVSDISFESDNIISGTTINITSNDGIIESQGGVVFTSSCIGCYIVGACVYVAYEEGATISDLDVEFPEKGIYFMKNDTGYVTSLTIPGYTGFTTPSQLPAERLPEHSHNWSDLGYSPTGGDTLTWDGNTEGLVQFENGGHYKISDKIPTVDDFSNGVSLKVVGIEGIEEILEFPAADIVSLFSDDGCLFSDIFSIVPADNYTNERLDGHIFPEAGIYFLNDDGMYTTSLTISGYTGFPLINKIPEEYLPEDITVTNGTVKITNSDDTQYMSMSDMGLVVLNESKVMSIMSDSIQFVGSTTGKVTGLAAPTADSDATNKEYVDGAISNVQTQLDSKLNSSKIIYHNSTSSLPAVTNGAILIAYDA